MLRFFTNVVKLKIGSWSVTAEGKFISKYFSTNYFSSQLNELKCVQKETEFMKHRETDTKALVSEGTVFKINLIMLIVTICYPDCSNS